MAFNGFNAGSVYASLKLDSSNFTQGMQGAKSELGGFGGLLGGTGKKIIGLAGGLAIGTTAFFGLKKIIGGISRTATNFIKESIQMNAEMERLSVSVKVLAQNADVSEESLKNVTNLLLDEGKSMYDILKVQKQLISGNIDMTKSEELVQVARDAGAFGLKSSAEALDAMLYSMQNLTFENLRAYGINMDLSDVNERLANKTGKTATETTRAEQRQEAFNMMLEKGIDIAGLYEAQMGTWGKTLNSVQDLTRNFKTFLGSAFSPVLSKTVGIFYDWVKKFKDVMREGSQARKQIERFGLVLRKAVNPYVEKLRDYFKNFRWGDFIRDVIKVAKSIINLGDAIVTVISAALDPFIQRMSDLEADDVAENIDTTANKIRGLGDEVSATTAILGGLWSSLKLGGEILYQAARTGKNFAAVIASAIADMIRNIKAGSNAIFYLGQATKKVFQGDFDDAAAAWHMVQHQFSSMGFGAARAAWGTMVVEFNQGISSLAERAYSDVIPAWNAVSDALLNVRDGAVGMDRDLSVSNKEFSDWWNRLKGLLDGDGDGDGDDENPLAEAAEKGEDAWKDAMKNIEDAVRDTGDILKELRDKWWETFTEFSEKIKEFKHGWRDLGKEIKTVKLETKNLIYSLKEQRDLNIADAIVEAQKKVADAVKESDERILSIRRETVEQLADLEMEKEERLQEIRQGMDDTATEAEKREATLLMDRIRDEQRAKAEQARKEEKQRIKEEKQALKAQIGVEQEMLRKNAGWLKKNLSMVTAARKVASLDAVQLIRRQYNQEKNEAVDARKKRIKELYKAFNEEHKLRVKGLAQAKDIYKLESKYYREKIEKMKKNRERMLKPIVSDLQAASDIINKVTYGEYAKRTGGTKSDIDLTKSGKGARIEIGNIIMRKDTDIDLFIQRLAEVYKVV